MSALSQAAEHQFLNRLVELASDLVREDVLDPDLRIQCAKLRDRARRLGLLTEFEIASFVACGIYFGTDFDSRKDLVFRQILLEPDTEPRLKAAQMVSVLEEAEQAEE